MNFKHIHIGQIIKQSVPENGIKPSRICNFLKCSEDQIQNMYRQENLNMSMMILHNNGAYLYW